MMYGHGVLKKFLPDRGTLGAGVPTPAIAVPAAIVLSGAMTFSIDAFPNIFDEARGSWAPTPTAVANINATAAAMTRFMRPPKKGRRV
jgi:hypothetical protein